MLVRLKRMAFIRGQRFRENFRGTEIPDEFRNELPKDAEILDAAPPAPAPEKPIAMSKLATNKLPLEATK